ncbi:murein biosynthesis integral membrane protein MurJ [Sporosarcina sp. NPDC096371]|uniref:murein biosynthesis integral membrane protein MurJ n=1 Tax=Sporosarcina sp. NPDC096371 TaxID=3364530 RepID=UPI0037F8121E
MKKTAMILMVIAILSKVIGFSRDLILSYFYGISDLTDAYFISNTIPTVLFSVVGLGLLTSFIPVYQKIRLEKGDKHADRFTNNIINIVFLCSVIILILGLIFTDKLVSIFAPGFADDVFDTAIIFTRINLFSILFIGHIYIIVGYLNANNTFVGPSIRSIAFNITLITFIFLSYFFNNAILLPSGVVVAMLIQFLLLIHYLRKINYSYSFKLNIKDEYLRKMFYMSLPIMISVSINQINVIVDKSIASEILQGGISSLTYANIIYLLVDGIIIVTLLSIVFPKLNNSYINKQIKVFICLIKEIQKYFVIVIIPITIILIYFSYEIVNIIYGRGSFDKSDVKLTAGNLSLYSIGIIGFALRDLYSKAFYAMENTKIPMINATIALFINIILNFVLSSIFGIGGLALATSISGIVAAILIGYSLNKKVKIFSFDNFFINSLKFIVLNSVFFITLVVTDKILSNYFFSFISLVLSSLISICFYVILLSVFKLVRIEKIISKIVSFNKKK